MGTAPTGPNGPAVALDVAQRWCRSCGAPAWSRPPSLGRSEQGSGLASVPQPCTKQGVGLAPSPVNPWGAH